MSDKQAEPGNIKEGGYQPISNPPSPPTGEVSPQAVNPITGNPNGPGAPPPSSRPPADRTPAPRTPPASDGH